jgi:hypothetical protein
MSDISIFEFDARFQLQYVLLGVTLAIVEGRVTLAILINMIV